MVPGVAVDTWRVPIFRPLTRFRPNILPIPEILGLQEPFTCSVVPSHKGYTGPIIQDQEEHILRDLMPPAFLFHGQE